MVWKIVALVVETFDVAKACLSRLSDSGLALERPELGGVWVIDRWGEVQQLPREEFDLLLENFPSSEPGGDALVFQMWREENDDISVSFERSGTGWILEFGLPGSTLKERHEVSLALIDVFRGADDACLLVADFQDWEVFWGELIKGKCELSLPGVPELLLVRKNKANRVTGPLNWIDLGPFLAAGDDDYLVDSVLKKTSGDAL